MGVLTPSGGGPAFGLQLPIQSQSTRYAQPWEAGCGVEDLAAIARACDRNGFLYVGVCDHVAIPRPHDEAMGTEWWDTMTTLGYLAGITESTHLLSHVYVLPYRHPLAAAKAWLTLDAVSGGRAVLGVGAGHLEAEFDLLGADFARRGRVLDESIDLVRRAFTDEYVDGAGLRPRPVRPGGPPIWVGGSSKAAMRRAAERGDGWLPQGPPEMGMRAAISFVREHRAASRGDDPFDVGIIAGPVDMGAGAEAVAGRLRRMGEMGADHIQVSFTASSAQDYCEQVDRFGEEIAPLLR